MDKNLASTPPKKIGISDKGQERSVISIIRADALKEGVDPDSLIYSLGELVKDPYYQLVQFNNTVFLLHMTQPYTIELSLFSDDNIMGIMSSLKQMIAMAKSQGFKKGIAYTDQPVFKDAVKRSNLPIKMTQTVENMGGEMKPVYKFEMDI